MKQLARISALIALLSGAAIVAAQDDESQSDVAESQEPEVSSEEDDAPVSDDVFIPTEEVQAAEELSFPVDI